MTEDYRPRSPDFSSPSHPPPSSSSFRNPSVSQLYVPPFEDMARRSTRLAQPEIAMPEYMPEQITEPAPEPVSEYVPELPLPAPVKEEEMAPAPAVAPLGAGIEVKTKFPVARIKRIMQADEDVGKVAQVTPIAVSKALELFMISLVTKAAQEAKDRNSKRVTASHLKHAVAKDEVLDFLADIIAKVPDQPAGRKHEDDGSDQNEGRRKRGGRRPKEESD
ncbi:uncharacterized protein N7511_011477 [Penicillium nucicola]|uniref:uncharacterized protein n=1 Tax=Penicillium nucicola TaxID=1850975 RepID=UPI002544ECB1|nr:uncharacterized protein N7511_011477 [Penicillium nucicola]KAJ5742458.1 hypothetical protein N7511_011477 [Penicillium nucicola]